MPDRPPPAPALTLPRTAITGLVVCGGQGTRMGGVDKGLQALEGLPLVKHALQRLAPQVGPLMLNANRHLDAYAALSVPVWPDELPPGVPAWPGPLAGWLAALSHCQTPWLAAVPCDSPRLPLDLVERLAAALLAAGADTAMATTLEAGRVMKQPVFCLMKTTLAASLAAYLQAGGRKIETWVEQQRCVHVAFDDAAPFFNVNTLADLQGLN